MQSLPGNSKGVSFIFGKEIRGRQKVITPPFVPEGYNRKLFRGPQLVPIAKAYSGLTDEEIRKVDAFVRRHTTEKFGPIRTVAPEHVFELAFEGIQNSTRHKCGVAVRFPRILRWRTDKKPEDADTLASLKALLNEAETVGS